MPAPDLKTIDIGNDERISYREAGNGTPVVILHGLGGRSESWVPQYEALSGRYRIIGWDAPGYNQSSEMLQDEPLQFRSLLCLVIAGSCYRELQQPCLQPTALVAALRAQY